MRKIFSTITALVLAFASCQPCPAFADNYNQSFSQPSVNAGPRPFFETNNPGLLPDIGWLFTKDNGGITDLYYEDSAGATVQLTGLGGGAQWIDTGSFLYPTGGSTRNVVVGAISMSGDEDFRVVGKTLLNSSVPSNGTGTISSVGSAVTGVGTQFLTELTTSSEITADGITSRVIAIADNNHLTVDIGPGVPWAADAFTYSKATLTVKNSAGTDKFIALPSGAITAKSIYTLDQPNIFAISGVNPKLSIGFSDDTVYHQLRSFGGLNDNIGIDVLNPNTHYFAVNGQLQNSKGTQIGYAFGTTPATGGLNVSGYTKIGGSAVSGSPTIQGDAINFEVGSANSALGNIIGLSNNAFSNPFDFFVDTIGIPERIYSLDIESSPQAGGSAKKVFTSADTTVIDYDAYMGATTPSQPAYRFTATKSNGAGGNASFAAGETVYAFNNRNSSLLYLTGDGTGHFLDRVYAGTAGTSAIPGFKFPNGDGIYSPGAGEIALSTGVTNFDSARFYYSGGTNAEWKYNTTLHLKDFSGTEIFRATGNQLSFYGGSVAAQQAVGATLTNNVTSGGTSNQIDNITAADVDVTAAKLTDTRDAIYQLTVKVRALEAALKAISLIKN